MARGLRVLLGAVVLGLLSATPARAIGFIDSPTAYCRKLKGGTCVINWYYISVNASPNYLIELWVYVEDRMVYHANGFFQTSLYIPGSDAFGEGIPVKCGSAGENTDESDPANPILYGISYDYTIRAKDSADLKSANYGKVICPPR
jgi:hypothetical protein